MAKETPFTDLAAAAGGRMTEYAGYRLPLWFYGQLAEHRAVRERVGLFDVSHMGRFRLSGAGAQGFLERVLAGAVPAPTSDRVRYNLILNSAGGILDDLLVYPLGGDYGLVVNAANALADLAYLRSEAPADVTVSDESDRSAALALQGPRAAALLKALAGEDFTLPGPYRYSQGKLGELEVGISRTGYTGEDGFELYTTRADGPQLWEEIRRVGGEYGLALAGLAARDSLRFEAALPLYGQELGPKVTPLEAGLERFLAWERPFCGREALLAGPPTVGLRGLRILDRASARSGAVIYRDGETVGRVTTGMPSPTLGVILALAYLPLATALGERLAVEIRGRRVPVEVIRIPFYRRLQQVIRTESRLPTPN